MLCTAVVPIALKLQPCIGTKVEKQTSGVEQSIEIDPYIYMDNWQKHKSSSVEK